MKLISIYRRYTFTTLIVVVLTSFTIHYYLFRYSIHRTTDDVLNEYRIDIEKYAAKHGELAIIKSFEMKLSTLCIENNYGSSEDIDETIRDTLVFSHYENEMVVYRKLSFPVTTPEHSYVVKLMLPTLEEHDLISTVIISLFIVVMFYILFSTITSWAFANKILKPFNSILYSMRTYNLSQPQIVELKSYGIDEFDELNGLFKDLMNKINEDYNGMKNFLENTSHELQTPLSIMQLKLENLNQTEFQSEDSAKQLVSVQMALKRVIRFNRSLLLIAKIQNNQYSATKKVCLNDAFKRFLDFYREIIEVRYLKLRIEDYSDFWATMNLSLVEPLVQNLITNAVKHSSDHGTLKVCMTHSEITITNNFSGSIPEGNLFEKYNYGKNRGDSHGIGLAIVKSICDISSLKITYHYANHLFHISITNM